VAHVLHLSSQPSFEGRTCLELGCGWVLTHSLVFHLLGAEVVIATDVTRQADPAAAKRAVQTSVGSVIRDILSPFADHERLRDRMDHLLAWQDFSFGGLERLGIHYVAPLDLARRRIGAVSDFVYSNSVLEHVPLPDVDALLSNVLADLSPDGGMLHAIHLEDHLDHVRAPFEFLKEPASTFGAEQQTRRGNRLRASAWMTSFTALAGSESRVLYSWKRSASLLPSTIDPSIAYESTDDLRTSHIGIELRRTRG